MNPQLKQILVMSDKKQLARDFKRLNSPTYKDASFDTGDSFSINNEIINEEHHALNINLIEAENSSRLSSPRPGQDEQRENDLINEKTIKQFTDSAFRIVEMKKALKAFKEKEKLKMKKEYEEELVQLFKRDTKRKQRALD